MLFNVTLKDSYPTYLVDNKEPVKEMLFRKIAYDFCKFIMDKVKEGFEVTLPERMGRLFIVGSRIIPKIDEETGEITNLAIDWKSTNQLWKDCPECKEAKQKIYYMNEHTNNVRYTISWSKKDLLVENQYLYTLQFCRANRRSSAKLFKEGKEYMVKN